jgi:hypothetical protein
MPIWLLAFVMPEKPGHIWVPFLGAGGVFWMLTHVMELGKGGGRFSRGGYSQISVNNARTSAWALKLAIKRTGMYFWAG